MAQLDRLTETVLRGFASRTSRRSVFSVLGGFLAGAAALPLLPVAKGADAPSPVPASDPTSGETPPVSSGNPQDPGDQTKCDYWRYCAVDGSLCSCYGGSVNACPPGTEMSPITWIGTCRNPADQKNYIISYNDCCGGVPWGRCNCQNNQGDRPLVRPQNNNEITWCFGTQSQSYTCTVALILGVALEQKNSAARWRLPDGAPRWPRVAVLAVLAAAALPAIAEEPSGPAVFAARCAVCHGQDAAGIPGTFPSLHEQIVEFGKSAAGRDYLVMVVTTGLMGELKVGGVNYNNVMPPQPALSEAEVAAVLSYLIGDRGKIAGAPVLTATDVTAARGRHAAPSAQSTRALRPASAAP